MQNTHDARHGSSQTIGPLPNQLKGFEVSVLSGAAAVREALRQILDALKPLALDIEEASTVELVLAEALNNVVEHAYPDPTKEGPINIRCRHLADGLHFRVNDYGQAMPDGQTPLGQIQCDGLSVEELPEGGFGWFLIRSLAKDIEYARVGQENQLDLRIAVAYGRPN